MPALPAVSNHYTRNRLLTAGVGMGEGREIEGMSVASKGMPAALPSQRGRWFKMSGVPGRRSLFPLPCFNPRNHGKVCT